ncbi:MAG TPA: hypothetical protein VMJ72_01430 [Candidatus Paceibacterota bacterium]|nr:hypothetical protein [Candidatus Paceibacterota bacterium]
MKRELKTADDYESVIAKELEYYAPMAADLNLSEDVILQAARLGARDGIYGHRRNKGCKYRESECVTWNIRHFVDLTLVRAALLASSEEEMDKAESVLMRLIED